MDKKQQQQQYSRQGSSKALSSDSRKCSELYSNKPWPKNTRRRENPNCPASKNDSQRSGKVGPAKSRPNVDKRPKARGGPTGTFCDQSTFEDVSTSSSGLALEGGNAYDMPGSGNADHFEYELNSVYAAGSKKQNLNHLLNFHYGPREFDNYSGLNVFGKHCNPRAQVKKHKYNKEQYLQANFQFVINWKAKPEIISSPDTLIDWNLIEQINIQTTEEPQCPICLYPPLAAKLTRCGHAYCWPCILHYLALSDKTWRKCPICYEAIHTNDLKSTTIVQQKNFGVGTYIKLQLMQRKKGTFLIKKYDSSYLNEDQLPLYSTSDDESKFAKFLVASRSDVVSIIEREQQELEFVDSEENGPEFVFVQQALDLLNARKCEINNEIDSSIEMKAATLKMKNCTLKENKPLNMENENEGNKPPPGEDEQNTKHYYFYQSVDGQNIFLHPLNVKMLQACYGSLDQAPLVINARILQKEHHSMDEEHRRKFTCLGHLPLTCHFEVVEVQLDPPIVSDEIMSIFKDDILQRKKARQRRDRQEKKREIKINAINDKQMGKLLSTTADINLSSSHEFPTCGFEETLTKSPNELKTDAIDIPPKPSTSMRTTYSSVANSVGSLQAELWPSFGLPNSPNTSKVSVWGKEATVARPRMSSDRYSESDSLNEFASDEYHPEFHPAPNLGDVLAEAISQKNNSSSKTEANGGNKKSKKNKKMLLFSTGMNYSGK